MNKFKNIISTCFMYCLVLVAILFVISFLGESDRKKEQEENKKYQQIYAEAYNAGYEKGYDDGRVKTSADYEGNGDGEYSDFLWRNIYNAGFDFGFMCGYVSKENGIYYNSEIEAFPYHNLEPYYQGIYEYCYDHVFDDINEP